MNALTAFYQMIYGRVDAFLTARIVLIDLPGFEIAVGRGLGAVYMSTLLKSLQKPLLMRNIELYEPRQNDVQFHATAFISEYCTPNLIEDTRDHNGRKHVVFWREAFG